MTIGEALRAAAARLHGASETPRLDAELLMAHALGTSRETLLLSRLDDPAPDGFRPILDRRAAGEPVAYIVGTRAFWTIELKVGPGALVPRPDSETLIEAALDRFGAEGPATILDLGTGPGTLLLAALDQWPRARGIGVDRSAEALTYARANAEHLGLADRAEFRTGNWAEGIDGPFDLVLCNPPYVETTTDVPAEVAEWEPHGALFAGADGLDDYRVLAPQIGRLIAPAGIGCIEIGAGQAAAAGELFAAADLSVSLRRDLAGRARCLVIAH